MNKIRNLEALEAIRSRLPSKPPPQTKDKRKSGRQGSQEPPQAPLSADEAEAYGQAFDALLTLWQVSANVPLPAQVARAHRVATLRLQPLLGAVG
jgi:hypothetical protein